mmetsp:Transcript_20335/g.49847  ORF Transcript_20335/g.49847 Transcript_20335/m.49847 type:complete len:119 (-) Transcript_20335:299-655(-)
MKTTIFSVLALLLVFGAALSAATPTEKEQSLQDEFEEEVSGLEIAERGGDDDTCYCPQGYWLKCRWVRRCGYDASGYEVCYYKLVCKCVKFPYQCPDGYHYVYYKRDNKYVWTCKPKY